MPGSLTSLATTAGHTPQDVSEHERTEAASSKAGSMPSCKCP